MVDGEKSISIRLNFISKFFTHFVRLLLLLLVVRCCYIFRLDGFCMRKYPMDFRHFYTQQREGDRQAMK